MMGSLTSATFCKKYRVRYNEAEKGADAKTQVQSLSTAEVCLAGEVATRYVAPTSKKVPTLHRGGRDHKISLFISASRMNHGS